MPLPSAMVNDGVTGASFAFASFTDFAIRSDSDCM
jgi:hypothetical protein